MSFRLNFPTSTSMLQISLVTIIGKWPYWWPNIAIRSQLNILYFMWSNTPPPPPPPPPPLSDYVLFLAIYQCLRVFQDVVVKFWHVCNLRLPFHLFVCLSVCWQHGKTVEQISMKFSAKKGHETWDNLKHLCDVAVNPLNHDFFMFPGSALVGNIMENGRTDFHLIFKKCQGRDKK